MVKEKLSNSGLCLICYYIMNSMFLGVGLYNVFLLSKEGTIICTIIGSILGIIPISIYLYIFKNNNCNNIFELNTYLFGKIFGNILNVTLSLLAIFIAVVVLYNLTIFLNLNCNICTLKRNRNYRKNSTNINIYNNYMFCSNINRTRFNYRNK